MSPTDVELSVLVPCFNEEGNLPELVERTLFVFTRRSIDGEIVLVNDGSRDGTGAQIDALAEEYPNVVAVHHAVNQGITAGWKTGLQRSRGRYVCTIDADLQYQPEAIALLHREALSSGVDVVQGWRSSLERYQFGIRYVMSRVLDYILKFVFGMEDQHDVKSGFVLYKREIFDEILAHAPGYSVYQSFVTVAAKAKGYSIRQVETLFEERQAGQSFIPRFPMALITRQLIDVARAFIEFRLRGPKDQVLALALRRQSGEGPVASRSRSRSEPTPPARARTDAWRASDNAPRYLDELRETQWMSPADLEALQLRRLQRLVQHAHDHVGFYREALTEAGIRPDDVRSLEDLARLPILEKQALRENLYCDILSDNHDKRRIAKIVATGRDDEPLALFVDQDQLDVRWASAWRALEWAGQRYPDLRAELVHGGAPGFDGPSPSVRWALARERRLELPATGPPGTEVRVREALARYGPAVLTGDAGSLVRLAAEGEGGPALEAIVSWGRTLEAGEREAVEKGLGGPVFDEYGAREVGPIAHACATHDGLHVHAESVLVEVVRDGRAVAPGETGEVLVTDLVNRVVPLLRYRLGDRAELATGPCACGRGLPVLRRVEGRAALEVVAGDGRRVPRAALAHILRGFEFAIRRFRVESDEPGSVRLSIERKSRFTADTETTIRRALAEVLGLQTVVTLAFEDEPAASRRP